jgi:hypothetical protein
MCLRLSLWLVGYWVAMRGGCGFPLDAAAPDPDIAVELAVAVDLAFAVDLVAVGLVAVVDTSAVASQPSTVLLLSPRSVPLPSTPQFLPTLMPA